MLQKGQIFCKNIPTYRSVFPKFLQKSECSPCKTVKNWPLFQETFLKIETFFLPNDPCRLGWHHTPFQTKSKSWESCNLKNNLKPPKYKSKAIVIKPINSLASCSTDPEGNHHHSCNKMKLIS